MKNNVPKVRQLKSGVYYIQLRLGGESITVKNRYKNECIKEARRIKHDYLAGNRRPKDEPSPITIGQAIDAYIEKRDRVLSPSTIAGYKRIKKTRFLNYTDKIISEMSDGDWQRMCNDEAHICSAKTLKNAWGLVSSVIKDSTGHHAPDVRLPQIVQKELVFLEPEQIQPFIKAVKWLDIEIPALLALSSLRRSELMGLTWDNVDLRNKLIYVRGSAVLDEINVLVQKKENKNSSSNRVIPIMMDSLYDALNAVEDKTGNVVKYNVASLWGSINAVCRRNGFPEVGVHGLRRSFVSLGFHLGIEEEYIMKLGGWSDYNTMRKYYKRLAQSDIAKHTKEMTDFFNSKQKPKRKNA